MIAPVANNPLIRTAGKQRQATQVEPMTTLQHQIAEKFLVKLAESKEMDAEKIEQLKTLLAQNKKVKADDLVKIFSVPLGGDIR
jgi:predicted transcriptional regulator